MTVRPEWLPFLFIRLAALAEVNSQPRADPAPTPYPSKDAHPSSSGSGVTSGPMSEWNVDALVALKGKLKLKVKMIALASILEIPAGGFMSSAEAQSVRDKTGDAQQIEQVIDILQGKGDKEFATFCQMLQKSNYPVWAHELEVEAEKFKTSDALLGTDPAPLRGNPQAVMSTRAPTPSPSKKGGVPSQSARSPARPLSPTLNNMCWPEFPALQDEFSTLVSELSETLQTLKQLQFDSLLVYLRERLRPMVDGCLPTEASPNIPDDPTPAELVRHLQKCHYWNYLNTDLVEGIIKRVSGEGSPLASLMAKYKESFRTKVTHTLEECKRRNVKPEPPPHYTTLAVEVNTRGNPLSFHLYQILQFEDLLVQKFGVNDVLFAGFTEGSIVLYFFIPEEAVYSLCPKLEANCTALEELHVTTLVVFGHFTVDVGYQQMSLLHKSWPSQVSSLEEEVTWLKQQLQNSEVDRETLYTELKECRKIKLEPGVYTTKPVLPMKHRLKEEGEEEEPDRKRVKTEMAETVEGKLESHPQEEKKREEHLYEPTPPSIIYERDPQTLSMFPSLSTYSSTEQTQMAETVEMELESHAQEEKEGDGGWYEPPTPSIIFERGPQTPSMFPPPSPYTSEHSLELAPPTFLHPESLEMGPPREEQAWVPPQVGDFSPHVFSGTRPPLPQPSSFQQPVQMGPPGSQTTQLQSVQSTASRSTQEVCSPASGSEVFQTSQLLEDQPTLHSVRLPDLPIAMSFTTALVIAKNVYVCGGVCPDATSERVVQVYDLDKETWTKLPPAPQYYSEAAAINNQLVLIGGREAPSGTITNMVSTWTGQDWQQDITAMPTKRVRPGVTTYNRYLMVAGGMAEDNQTLLDSIDVMYTTTGQWYTLANLQLPRPLYCMKITVSATHICVASAVIAFDADKNKVTPSKNVWELPVNTLSKVLVGEDSGPHQWTEIAQTPHYCSALLQDTAHPLVVGGRDDSGKPTADITVYDRCSNKWSKVGKLQEPRVGCTAVSLSRRSFLVCDGRIESKVDPSDIKTPLSSVEVVSVQ